MTISNQAVNSLFIFFGIILYSFAPGDGEYVELTCNVSFTTHMHTPTPTHTGAYFSECSIVKLFF